LTPDPLRLRELLARLIEADVRFVLVGGLAVNAWGYLRATRDIDFVPDPDPGNLARLDAVLRELGGKVDVDGELLAGTAISTFLRTGDRTLVATELGQVDVLQGLPQVPRFAALEEKAKDVDLDGLLVRVCSLEHLIGMKRASERPRDREDLAALEAVQEEGREGK
jgi:predicted nucleotidyltransferase